MVDVEEDIGVWRFVGEFYFDGGGRGLDVGNLDGKAVGKIDESAGSDRFDFMVDSFLGHEDAGLSLNFFEFGRDAWEIL